MEDFTGGVNYTVKELLARQDAKLDQILLTLSTKADQSQVDKLEQRVETIDRSGSQQAQEAARISQRNSDRLDAIDRDEQWVGRAHMARDFESMRKTLSALKIKTYVVWTVSAVAFALAELFVRVVIK